MMKFNLLIFFLLNFFMLLIMIFPSNLYKFHPLILSLLLVFYVILLCINLNFFKESYWVSYVLFLIMIGGLMILFMYFTSLASNQLFNLKMNYNKYLVLKYLLLLMMMFVVFKNFEEITNFIMINNSFENFSMFYMFSDLCKYIYMNLMIDFTMDMNLYMIMYLFMTMICSVLICLKIYIPLRQLLKF